jgi:hypothetical protein
MSTLNVNAIKDANGANLASLNGVTVTADNYIGMRNRIINGDCRIDQRNAGAAVTAAGSFPVDRFFVGNSTDGAFSAQQDSSAPAGFVNSVKLTTTTADATLTTTQNLNCQQRIEGTNVSDLAWGTANAKTVTLSFWVRSSLTGTFGGAIANGAFNRSYPFTYSISTADTWEQKSVTIPGDTSGTWLTNTGVGIFLFFGLGAGPDRSGTAGAWVGASYQSATGAVSVIGTLDATWYVTGVQLEVGSVATPFERRPYGTELALCQRYYWQIGSGASKVLGLGFYYGASEIDMTVTMPVSMRSTATIVQSTGTNYFSYNRTSDTFDSWGGSQFATDNTINLFVTSGVSGTTGLASYIITNNASASLALSAEL